MLVTVVMMVWASTTSLSDRVLCRMPHMFYMPLQVLLNAFGRALKDTFPPARCAALRAMAATLQYYSADEIACRALPAVCPLCVDPLSGGSQSTYTSAVPSLFKHHTVFLSASQCRHSIVRKC